MKKGKLTRGGYIHKLEPAEKRKEGGDVSSATVQRGKSRFKYPAKKGPRQNLVGSRGACC